VTITEADSLPVATPRVAVGALFVDGQGQILVVKPTYKQYWDIPGGYVEPGESPLAACRRELDEELGLAVNIGALLSVDWAPLPDEGDKMLLIFDGGQLTHEQLADITYRDNEVSEHRFADPDSLDELTIPRLARRLRETVRARAERQPVYLEHGTVPL
jgi:ADP-ribose pyrophosphatase YjhB (NUDIX family)